MRQTSVPDAAHWPLTHNPSWLDSVYMRCFHSGTVLPDSRKPSTMWSTTSERAPRRLRPRCSSPCLCALSRPTRWGASMYLSSLVCCQGAAFSLSWSDGKFPGFTFWMLSVSVRAEQGRALAASVPQDVAYSPRPNNRKGQLGLTPELQLCCLDWFPPASFPQPLYPRTASPCPTTQHTSWDCSQSGFMGSA